MDTFLFAKIRVDFGPEVRVKLGSRCEIFVEWGERETPLVGMAVSLIKQSREERRRGIKKEV